MEDIKNTQTTISEKKNTLDVISDRLDITKGKIV